MRKQTGLAVAVVAVTVVIPTVVAMMFASIDPSLGWLLIACSASIGAVAFAVALWPERVPPDYDKWDQREGFTLREAAWLWTNQEPKAQGVPFSWKVRSRYRRLESAVRTRQLAVLRNRHDSVSDALDETSGIKLKANPKWIVKREDLMQYADAIGKRPPFLFERERT